MALLGTSTTGLARTPTRDPDRWSAPSNNSAPIAQNPTGTYGSPWDQSGSYATQSKILFSLYNSLYGPGAKDPRDLLRALAGAQYDEQRDQNQINWLKTQKGALPMQGAIDQGRYENSRSAYQALAQLLGGELTARLAGYDNDRAKNELGRRKDLDQFGSQIIEAGGTTAPGYNRDIGYINQQADLENRAIDLQKVLADNSNRQSLLTSVFQPSANNEWTYKQNQLDNAMKGNSLDSDIRDSFLKLLQDKLGTAAAKDKWDERGVTNLDIGALTATLPPDMQAFFKALYSQTGG